MSKSNYHKVYDFYYAFNLLENSFVEKDEIHRTKIKLLNEYRIIFNKEFKNDNIGNFINNLLDLIYIYYGCAINFNVDINNAFNTLIKSKLIHDNRMFKPINLNLTNFQKVNQIINQNNVNTIQKNNTLNNYSINKELLSIKLGSLNSIINEFIYNINNNLSLVKSNITNGLFELYSIGSILGLNIDKLFEELHISNMTMLCSENDASRLMLFKQNNEVKNLNDIEIHKSNLENYYILYNKSTGEILKSEQYINSVFV